MRCFVYTLLLLTSAVHAQWELDYDSTHAAAVVQDTRYAPMVQLESSLGVSAARSVAPWIAVGPRLAISRAVATPVVNGFRYRGTTTYSIGFASRLRMITEDRRLVAPTLSAWADAAFLLYDQANLLLFFPTIAVAPGLRIYPGAERPGATWFEDGIRSRRVTLAYADLELLLGWAFRTDLAVAAKLGIRVALGVEMKTTSQYIEQ